MHAHTVDAIGDYRLEIGWMNEPVVSGETNGIELYISPLGECPDLEPMKCAESQEFADGVGGLAKDVKIQLTLKQDKITLPLAADHDIPGKYYAFVNPTVSGYYQANLLGDIQGTPVSLSMHPPKVNERAYIEFPEPADLTVEQMIDGHTALIDEVSTLKSDVREITDGMSGGDPAEGVGYAGIGLGIAGIAVASVALSKRRSGS
ncbi:hypothetical protein CENSYa_1873 [Cenarchaeum symbiosum A]|uniref:Uncharacterized protein n=1 Tax=Cenarchaeum symbiosum (strain A) TaxID=414004 RepID=A0RYR5_CENSY|nr:hypothetical protein CENSYa_1873 [Cenarchaeum symbiosum A]